ncbi:MAG: dolichyl-phosphate beta-glucosyltransferase [Anaerolineales bacterium]
MPEKPYLSIIIPAHNEEHRLPTTIAQLFHFLTKQSYPAEVIVVENGSSDRTLELAQSLSQEYAQLRVIHEERAGKGLAVRQGMLAARGKYRFMCDVDFSMPIDQINRFFPPQLTDADIAIASREAKGAKRFHEPPLRHTIGRVFNLLIRLFALPEFHDTQCGFKCFTEQAAQFLFERQSLAGWTFDVEILYMARQAGFRIVEVPIPWYYNPESKVHVLRDSLQMGWDLLKLRWRASRGLYNFD